MVNKTSEVQNSALVKEYAKLDGRFRAIMMYLKSWNKSLSNDKLNNFTLSLMVIAFMQSIQALPNLQALADVNPRCILHTKQV